MIVGIIKKKRVGSGKTSGMKHHWLASRIVIWMSSSFKRILFVGKLKMKLKFKQKEDKGEKQFQGFSIQKK